MSDLIKWGGGGIERAANRSISQVVSDGMVVQTELAVEAQLWHDAMGLIADLDNERMMLAGDSQVLNAVLGRMEVGAAAGFERIIKQRTNPLTVQIKKQQKKSKP